jgi:hypothetical protein
MHKQYQMSELTVTSFNGCEPAMRRQFEGWVRSLTIEHDNEPGDDPEMGTWRWVCDNNLLIESDDRYGTFIFVEQETGEILSTGSFMPDDRGVARQLELDSHPNYLGMFGFVQVKRSRRGAGLGVLTARWLDRHVQSGLSPAGEPADVYLFSDTPRAIKVWQKLGFAQEKAVWIPDFQTEEQLFKKTYLPQSLLPRP